MNYPSPDFPQFDKYFQANFAAIAPLILEEWEGLDPAELQATAGHWETVIIYIAITTGHTKALICRHLQELYQITIFEYLKTL